MVQREKEIDELKSKIAEVMAVMPSTPATNYTTIADNVSLVNSLLPVFGSHVNYNNIQDDHNLIKCPLSPLSNSSGLDPNASIYTPKVVSSPDL